MKKTLSSLLALFLMMTILSGCSGKKLTELSNQDVPETVDIPKTSFDGGLDNLPDESLMVSYTREDGPRFDLPDDMVKRYMNFVAPFNILPEPFESVADLSDQTLIFTAAAAIQVEFIPLEDDMGSYVPLSKIRSRIKEFFGPEAKLSDNYLSSDISPYEFDAQNDLLIQYYAGSIGGFFLPYALITIEGGYELWLIDLMDPLFFDKGDNQERLLKGETIEYSEIIDIALLMQYNIYRVSERDNGRLTLTGFRYENKKSINHFLF